MVQTNNSNYDVCSVCSNLCHKRCSVELNGDHTCLSCNTGELEETQQDGTHEPQENTLAKAESPINSNANKPIPKPRNNPDNKPVPKPRKSSHKEQNQPDRLKEVKLYELRAREAKLRKAEEQLRIKEKSIQELNNEKILIGTRCQQLEARNYELEQNVKLLKRMIDSNQYLQTQNENEAGKVRCEIRTDTDNDIYNIMKQHMNTKIMDLHTKLTNLVFHEIDRPRST
jgi:hypothetical protein